jgi:transposase
MPRGRRPNPFDLSDDDRRVLTAWTRRPTTAQALALRARIVLACADRPAETLRQIARECSVHEATVGKWRRRFVERGPDGLLDAPRPGAPRSISDDDVDRVVAMTLESTPEGATHWSTRSMARAAGVSQTAVSRIWRAFGLKPHRAQTFKLSTDPLFVDKVRDVVGLYVSPPANAMVLCVDEKPQIQALTPTAPVLPMTPGVAERRTHDYVRHGTTDLFAALDVHSGRVVGERRERHRSVDFCAFLDAVEAAIPAELDVHLVLDNASTHKAPPVKAWLLAHPRYVLHFVPTSSSWLNLVECWFSLLTRKQLQRGVYPSVELLKAAISAFVWATNAEPRPFVWTKTADEILASVGRFCHRITNSDH